PYFPSAQQLMLRRQLSIQSKSNNCRLEATQQHLIIWGKKPEMAQKSCESLDPRIRRTRQLLQQALFNLLQTKDFDSISVQDITDAATVNRATFYDHYPDKFALLNCMVGVRFHELLAERQVRFDGGCSSALKAIVLAVCDYLAGIHGPEGTRRLEPHMESAIIAVVRGMLL